MLLLLPPFPILVLLSLARLSLMGLEPGPEHQGSRML